MPILISILIKKLTGLTREQLSELFANEEFLSAEDFQLENGQSNDVSNPKENQITEEIVSTVASKAVEKALIQHTSTKKSIEFFKINLLKLANQLSKLKTVHLPIFIFVDELDRCRPSYAIELLECIKHLFGVRGIYFVIATDSRQLTHSIKAVYGDGFDSTRYLKRFFDQEYSFLPPDNLSFASHLFQQDNLDEESKLFLPHQSTQGISISNSQFFALCATYFDLSLRDQEQVYSSLNAFRLSYEGESIHLAYTLFLIILRHRFSDAFDRYSRVDQRARKLILKEIHDKESTNQKVSLKTFVWSNNQGSLTEMPIEKVFSEYIDLSFISVEKLKTSHSYEFMEEVLRRLRDDQRNFQNKPTYSKGHDLDSYPDRILRIGRLT